MDPTSVVCPACHEPAPAAAAACPWCRSSLEPSHVDTSQCPTCNEAVRAETKTCPWCHSTLDVSSLASGCQECGGDLPTQSVTLFWNVGLLLLRFHQIIRGNLCRDCIGRQFWKCTAINMLLGWWGILSLFVTPVFLALNLATYIKSRGLPK